MQGIAEQLHDLGIELAWALDGTAKDLSGFFEDTHRLQLLADSHIAPHSQAPKKGTHNTGMNTPSSPVSLGYYTHHAEAYAQATRAVDMTPLYARFLPHVRAGGLILDAGCGSGRDALAFLQRGYAVEAFDASPELAQLASQHAGIPVKVMRFQDLDDTARFDAIWACASLLHVPAREQPDVWRRLWQTLKPGGVVYASYKLGQAERVDESGRAFTDANQDRLSEWLNPRQGIARVETWLTTDQRPGQTQTWLNALVHRHLVER